MNGTTQTPGEERISKACSYCYGLAASKADDPFPWVTYNWPSKIVGGTAAGEKEVNPSVGMVAADREADGGPLRDG